MDKAKVCRKGTPILKKVPTALAIFVVLLVFGCWALPAKDKDRLPLAPQVMAAKIVYIENRSGQAAIGDRAYQELKAWGRFQIVQDKSMADLIFLLTLRSETVGSSQSGRVDDEGNIHTTSTADVWRYSGLTVLDAKTGDTLWTESKVAAILRKSAIKRAVDEFRKRIEEQAADPHRGS